MSEADRAKWSARYGGDDAPPKPPDPFVVAALDALSPSGSALDLAGGLGRHGVELARRGWDTTVVDIAPEGLARARAHAQDQGLELSSCAIDLDADWADLDRSGPWSVVVVAWFLLTEPMWSQLVPRLAGGGRLIYVHPTLANLERHARPSARFLAPLGHLAERAKAHGLEVSMFEEGWDSADHHTSRLVAIAPTPPGAPPPSRGGRSASTGRR